MDVDDIHTHDLRASGPPEPTFEPAYRSLHRRRLLAPRARVAFEHLRWCDLCARACHVDRTVSTRGAVCRTGRFARVASYGPHHGEEAPLSGWLGSGTIFFSWCSLRCVYCQNWDISQNGAGQEVGPDDLAVMMLELESAGCHNINLVTPSHVVAQVLEAVAIAAEAGLTLPLVYNSGGYDSLEALELLDGVVDIYMPDMKYGDDERARTLSHVPDYVSVNRAAVREMHRQVGDLVLDADGVAQRGLLVRHLVLPGDASGTESVLGFIAGEVSPHTYVNLMDQYRPCYRADGSPPLDRPVSRAEFGRAMAVARRLGLTRLDDGHRLRAR
jgi:putative pyruvate formate lyase activating enzyme